MVLSFRHIQGSLGQRHDIYPQAWESDCGTYEKTTESRARARRWGTGFAIEDFQFLHVYRAIENGRCNRVRVKRAIENGRRNRVRHLNSPSAREMQLRGR